MRRYTSLTHTHYSAHLKKSKVEKVWFLIDFDLMTGNVHDSMYVSQNIIFVKGKS